MKMKNHSKFGEKLTCRFKINMKNDKNFDPSTWKSKTFAFSELFLTKVYKL